MSERPLAVILATADLERLYTGLSLLVSAAAEGRPVRGLATFGALDPLVDPELADRALDPAATPHLSLEGRPTFARSLAELRDLALPRLATCAASAQATGRRIGAVQGMPRFLSEAQGSELIVV